MATMKSKKTPWVASAALSALLIAALFLFSGCGEKEAAAPVAQENPNAPEVYMKDPVFLKQLEGQKKERNKILSQRCALDEALQAEKAKDPASPKVKELQAALDAADRAFESNRMASAAIVRARLTQKTTKEGKAK